MARVAVRTGSSLLVTGDTPFHVIPVHHFDRPFLYTGYAMAGGAVHAALEMDPVLKDNKFRKLVHPLPRNRFLLFHVLHNLQGFRPFTDGIARMAGPAEFDVWNSRNTIPFYVPVAEGAVQLRDLLVMDMVEENRLLDGNPSENWKQGEEGPFGLNSKPVVGNNGK